MPALLSCPVDTSASATAVIGPHGGTVSVGRFSLRLPPHAVEEPTLFTFTVPASQYLEVDIRANNADHFVFNRPATITIDYARCDGNVDRSTLDAWYIDRSSKGLIEAMHGHNALGLDEFVFTTGHLSGYALADRKPY